MHRMMIKMPKSILKSYPEKEQKYNGAEKQATIYKIDDGSNDDDL